MKNKITLITIIVFIVLFSVSSVSAAFPKVYYSEDFKEAVVVDWLGLGSEIAKITLVENTDYCFLDCRALLKVELNEDANKFYNDINFKSYDGEDLRNLDMAKYDYALTIKDEKESVTNELRNNEKLTKGTYYIEITASKEPLESIDWVIDVLDVSLTKMAWWTSSCSYKVPVNITNNNPTFPMIEHDVNISVDTTGIYWQTNLGNIRVVDKNTGGSQFERQWWNQTAFNSATTKIWFKTNVTAGSSNADIEIYYYCVDAPTFYNKNDTLTIFDDFDDGMLNTKTWTTITSDVTFTPTETNSYMRLNADALNSNQFGGVVHNKSYGTTTYSFSNDTWGSNTRGTVSLLIKIGLTGNGLTETDLLIDSQDDAVWGTSRADVLAVYFDSKNDQLGVRARDGGAGGFEVTQDYAGEFDQNAWTNITIFVNSSILRVYNSTSTPVLVAQHDLNLIWWNSNKTYLKIWAWDLGAGSEAKIGHIEVIKYFADTDAFSYTVGTAEKYNTPSEITVVSAVYNASTYETEKENFLINFTYNSTTYSSLDARFWYNNVSYTPTLKSTNLIGPSDNSLSEAIYHYKDLIMQNVNGPTPYVFLWEILLTNATEVHSSNSTNTTHLSQTVEKIYLSACNSTSEENITRTLNLTFKDETTNAILNASIDGTFYYYLAEPSVKKTYLLTTTLDNFSYAFCSIPGRKLTINSTIYYTNLPNYPQRTASLNGLYDYNTANTTLYLLSSTYGIYPTFQIVNPGNQPLEGVLVKAERFSGGVYTLVEQKTSDPAGAATFWVNPSITHRFTFSKDGYVTYVVSMMPTQTAYTVTLSPLGISSNVSYVDGISYDIYPKDYILNNGTDYLFSFNISSSVYTLQEYGFTLTNTTFIVSVVNGSVGTGGSVSSLNNTGNFTYLYMYYFWKINGTYANGSAAWLIVNTYTGNYSLKYFLDDLKGFSGSGFNSFTLALIAFVAIFLATAFTALAAGSFSSLPTLMVCEGMTILMCYANFLPSIPNNSSGQYFIAVVLGLLLIAFWLWDYRS